MKRFGAWAGAGVGVMALCASVGMAGAGSQHYVNGVEGIKGASLPPPGIYGRLYTAYYNADTLRDSNGDEADIGFDAKVMAAVPRLIWITPYSVLGADYGMDALIPITRTHVKVDAANADEKMTGAGDLFVEPLLLSWHLKQADFSAGAGAYLPTGYYSKDNAASPGMGFTTFMFTLGGTLYFDEPKTWSASMLNRYEISGYAPDEDFSPGDAYHFEWGVSKSLAKVWELGVAGYCAWQVADDTGSDAGDARSEHSRAFAAGPELSYFAVPLMLNVSLRHEREFEVRDGSEGHITTLTLTKVF